MKRDDLFAGYEQGQADMLAKCIAVVGPCHHTKYEGCRPCVHDNLRALQEKAGQDAALVLNNGQDRTESGTGMAHDKVTRMRDLTIPSDWDDMIADMHPDLTSSVTPG